jgi:hypothetical protein
MADNNRLPIQVVLPLKKNYDNVKTGGGSKYSEDYTPQMQKDLINQCRALQDSLKETFQKYPVTPCVGKVVMKEKAIAKSHKPTAVFKDTTCPIVGADLLGEILIKVTSQGLTHLINLISHDEPTSELKNNMVKIQEIKAYTLSEKIEIENFESIKNISEPLKIKLFNFDDNTGNQHYIEGFENLTNQYGLKSLRLNYGKNLCIFKLNCEDKEVLNHIIEYPGVKKVALFPKYTSEFPHIKDAERNLTELPMPIQGEDYPIVGLIDSGIIPGHKYLDPWIYKKEYYVGEDYRNYEHGTFVAGIIQYGAILNSNLKSQEHYKFLDVVVSPNNDLEKGPTDSL